MSMLIEKDLEANVVALLAEALEDVDAVRIEGSWQTDAENVKGTEDSADAVMIGVATGAPSFESFGVPSCDIPVSLGIVIRHEASPGGELVSTVMTAVSALLMDLQLCTAECVHTDLSTTDFTASGVRLEPGEAPSYDREMHVWTISRSFTVRGVVTPSTS